MGSQSTLASFLLTPALWWVLLVVWVISWLRFRSSPPVTAKKLNSKTARPGDLFADGSTATSKTEQKVRAVIEKAGYKLYPPSTRVWTHRDGDGKGHAYTPDIMLRKPKMIVEVDPHHWHGDASKIAHDIDRNRAYARLGYRIVRVRIAGTLDLSPNDIVIPQGDFDPHRDGEALLKAIRKAKMLSPKYWGDARKLIERGNAAGAAATAEQRRAMGQQPGLLPHQYPQQYPPQYPQQGYGQAGYRG